MPILAKADISSGFKVACKVDVPNVRRKSYPSGVPKVRGTLTPSHRMGGGLQNIGAVREGAMSTRLRYRKRSRGQALAEFALVAPVLLAVLGGIIQFGMVFWAQNTLTQVVRDTGRWAATQQYTGTQAGKDNCTGNEAGVVTEANLIAAQSNLIGYSSSAPWTSSNVSVTWTDGTVPISPTVDACPPPDNSQYWYVSIAIHYTVPTFFPGMQYLPGLGTCDTTGCHIVLSSSAQFRMEPAP